ncbi:hypothetical protein [Thiosulfatihalobacter marinus]|jgi:hypothetical protein|uniref:hypothetical protein n=1 Tax=Thiosulfatihalobacter marinus TaxID=2792481 RepID=UPI0018D9E8A8|nr:hypothetical protein [Thiosulfatihalobacter marinus]
MRFLHSLDPVETPMKQGLKATFGVSFSDRSCGRLGGGCRVRELRCREWASVYSAWSLFPFRASATKKQQITGGSGDKDAGFGN